MPESEEEKKKRWAAAASMSYMTPSMMHALNMSKQQSQNKYKEMFDRTKGKGYTSVASTPQIENAKKQSSLVSQNKYKSEFEKNKAKFTQVADNPELRLANRAGKQISNVEYHGKGSAICQPRKRRDKSVKAENSPSKSKERDANDVLEQRDLTHDGREEERINNRDSLPDAAAQLQDDDVTHDDDATYEESSHEQAGPELVGEDELEPNDVIDEQAVGDEVEEVGEQTMSNDEPLTDDTAADPPVSLEDAEQENNYDAQVEETPHYYDDESSHDVTAQDDDVHVNGDVENLTITENHYKEETSATQQEGASENVEEESNSLDDFYANLG